VNNEVSDATIIAYFEGSVPAEVTQKPVPQKPTTENPETSVDPREQEIKDKIELFEMVVNSGSAKPEDYKILNALYTELGKIVKSKC
jgi:hypothetical protein